MALTFSAAPLTFYSKLEERNLWPNDNMHDALDMAKRPTHAQGVKRKTCLSDKEAPTPRAADVPASQSSLRIKIRCRRATDGAAAGSACTPPHHAHAAAAPHDRTVPTMARSSSSSSSSSSSRGQSEGRAPASPVTTTTSQSPPQPASKRPCRVDGRSVSMAQACALMGCIMLPRPAQEPGACTQLPLREQVCHHVHHHLWDLAEQYGGDGEQLPEVLGDMTFPAYCCGVARVIAIRLWAAQQAQQRAHLNHAAQQHAAQGVPGPCMGQQVSMQMHMQDTAAASAAAREPAAHMRTQQQGECMPAAQAGCSGQAGARVQPVLQPRQPAHQHAATLRTPCLPSSAAAHSMRPLHEKPQPAQVHAVAAAEAAASGGPHAAVEFVDLTTALSPRVVLMVLGDDDGAGTSSSCPAQQVPCLLLGPEALVADLAGMDDPALRDAAMEDLAFACVNDWDLSGL